MTPSVHGNALPEGHRLLWYRIGRVLGQGGFGITYEAFDINLETPVAIKEYLPKEFAVREDDTTVRPFTEDRKQMFNWGLERFLQEARTLAKFHHPNIVRVYNVFEKNGTAYMVMDYEQGESLDQLFKFGRLQGEADLMRIVLPLLDGLEHMHEAGFIHRDIKPPNIYVRLDGSPVLLDFGSARFAIGGETKTLTSLVTPGFAPFEQYNPEGAKQGPWTDIYGMGATLYAGINQGRGPMEAIIRGNARIEGKPDPMDPAAEKGKGRYSPAFLDAIDAALGFTPQERPQTVAAWKKLFPTDGNRPVIARPASRPQAEVATVIHEQEPAPSAPRQHAVGKWLVAGLIVAGLAVGAYFARPWLASLFPGLEQQQAVVAEQQRQVQEAVRLALEAEAKRKQEEEQARLLAEQEQEKKRQAEQARLAAQMAEDQARLEEQRKRLAEEQAARQQQQRIEQLLANADKALAANRLTSPAGDNAMEYLQAVMALDSGNAQARQGFGRVASRYLGLASSAGGKGEWVRAEYFIDKADQIDPGAEAVVLARQKLAQQKRESEIEQARLAELERQRLEQAQQKQAAQQRAAREKLEKYKSLLAESEKAFSDKNYSLAKERYAKAAALQPEKIAEHEPLREKIENCLGIAGVWTWFNTAVVTINADGTLSSAGGLFGIFNNTGTWECSEPAQRKFILFWKTGGFVDKLTLSADGKELDGTGSLGIRVTGKRKE